VLVHGFTARFSHPVYVELGRGLAGRGYTSVTGNTRGWGFGDAIRRGSRDKGGSGEVVMVGGAWERFDESPHDVGAWVAFAAALGFDRVVLLGHSRGTRKVVYYQGLRQDSRVAALVLASPGLVSPPARDPELLALAARMVEDGRGRELLPWRGAAPEVSAQTYLTNARLEYDPYGVDNPDPLIARVRCPILAFYGTRDDEGMDALEGIRRAAGPDVRLETTLVEGADHVYTGRRSEVATVIADWLDATL
jgi:pimeloyl-ACP methyl ester carboxylesterase